MEANELFLEPAQYYSKVLKKEHENTINEFFDELTNKSGIDVEENRATAKRYYAKEEELNKAKKALSGTKTARTLLLIFGIILVVVIVGIFMLVYRNRTMKDKMNTQQEVVNKLDKELNEIKAEAEKQVAPLNALFTDKMSTDLITKSVPFLKFNETTDAKFMDRIIHQFGYEEYLNRDRSVLVNQSGTINTNPFLLLQEHVQTMVPHIYTGTLVITYYVTVRDEHGSHQEMRTQTLVAHVTKPEPSYKVETSLLYFSDAAPKLSFSRKPSPLCGKNEKDVERYVAKVEKEETKKAQKAIKKGESYTAMTNSKFEAYFNSEGRNNEVQYRLMFTPLAQTNLCYQFAMTEPYKDDIYYVKNECVNVIASTHSQDMDYSGGTYNYYHFDYDVIKKNFLDYNLNFFTGLYFDFLTFLSIPIFQQHDSLPYVEPITYTRNISLIEAETMVNKLDYSLLRPKGAIDKMILKTVLQNKGNGEDELIIESHSFTGIERVEVVPVMGGDGVLHPVPVPWIEYLPVVAKSKGIITNNQKTLINNENNIIIRHRGLSLIVDKANLAKEEE